MTARESAFKALGEFRRGKSADKARDTMLEKTSGLPREKALAMRLFYGVLQSMTLCDFYAGFFSTSGLKKVEPRVLDILRLSIYQLLFLSGTPHSAAVNEGVALAKKHSNPRAAGFVNAVLRKVSQAAKNNTLPQIGGTDAVKRLSILYSYPEWLVREFAGILGLESAAMFMDACNAADTPLSAQVNTMTSSPAGVLEMLESEGVDANPHRWLEGCIELNSAGDITRLQAFREGRMYVQDAASRLAVIAAGPKPGDLIVDGCAAPGGKSFAAAIAMENNGRIAACDISAAKLSLIEEGAKRLGIGIIEPYIKDASADAKSHVDSAPLSGCSLDSTDGFTENCDIVFADVPCSAFGVIRKKPDIRFKNELDVVGLPGTQKSILAGLSSYVKPGGILLYSTCTVLKRENEDVVNWFIREDGRFSLEGFSLPDIGIVPDGMITLWPHINGTDGFFICKLRRVV